MKELMKQRDRIDNKGGKGLEELLAIAGTINEMCEQETGISYSGYKGPMFGEKNLEKTEYARSIFRKRKSEVYKMLYALMCACNYRRSEKESAK